MCCQQRAWRQLTHRSSAEDLLPCVNNLTLPQVVEERVADDTMLVIKGAKTSRAATLLLVSAGCCLLRPWALRDPGQPPWQCLQPCALGLFTRISSWTPEFSSLADTNTRSTGACKHAPPSPHARQRGANDYMLDEMDRSLHDSLCVVKRVLESGNVVPGALRAARNTALRRCPSAGLRSGCAAAPTASFHNWGSRFLPQVISPPPCTFPSPGGGAVEAGLSIYLENFATTLGSREQLAIAEFAEVRRAQSLLLSAYCSVPAAQRLLLSACC